MIDGGPPKGFTGAGWGVWADAIASPNNRETNINWGDGERMLQEEVAPYMDLLFATENFGSTPIRRDFLDSDSRLDYEEIISEEITRMLLSWDQFIDKKLLCANYMKTHGLAFEFHGDDINWQWDVAGLQEFKIPIKTKLGEKNIKYCGVRVFMDPEDLYQKIKNPQAAKAGWNIPAVKKCVMDAAPAVPNYTDWEKWEEYWKDNDYLMSEDGQVCPVIYFWSQELDGTLSQYLFREDGVGGFLYKKIGKYADMSRFVHIYMDNIGTNGKYASIRGLAHRIYSMVQTLNRKINSFSDLVDLDSTPLFQPDADTDVDTMATEQVGPFTIINPGWKMPERQNPDYERGVIPAISMFSSMIQSRGGYGGRQGQYLNAAQKKGNRQAELDMAETAQLSDTSINLYYKTAQKWWAETVRRICRKGYLPSQPGGVEVAEFRRRCVERGVPEEAIYHVDYQSCRINRAIGAGSAQARIVTLDRLEQEAPMFDPVSQQLYARDKVRAIAGQQAADRYTPKPKDRRMPMDSSIAQVENAALIAGYPIDILQGQNDVAHAQEHLVAVSQLNDKIVEGGEPALVQNITPMSYLLNHTYQHLNDANPNDPMVKQLTKQAQQFDEIVTNGFKHVQKLQDNAMREMQHNSGKIGATQEMPPGQAQPQVPGQPAQPAGPDVGKEDANARAATTEAIKMQAMLNDLNYKAQNHQLQMHILLDRAQQAKKIADLKAATDISNS
jgi:hypothetical protein